MNIRIPFARHLLAAVTLCLAATPLHAQPAPGSFFIRGSLGMATQSLKDWRESIDMQKQLLASVGFPAEWENIGTAFVPGIELGYMVNDLISVGAGFSYQKGTSDNSYSDFSGSISQEIKASAIGLTGNVAFWPAGGRGLFIGGNAGIGLGKASNEIHFQDFTDPTNDLDVLGDWDGSGFMGGLFAGFQEKLGSSGIGFLKAWYQFANLGVFDGTVSSPQLGTVSAPPGPSVAQAFDTDLSGVGFALGFGVAFAGNR